MKFSKLVTLLTLTVLCSLSAKAQENASSIMEKALAQAKTENKKVFVKYGASWCGWCKKMDKKMKDDRCASFFTSNYVIVAFDVQESDANKQLETPGAFELLKKHHGDQSGLPFWVILDQNGTVVEDSLNDKGENLGCPATEAEVKDFTTVLKKTSNLTDDNLQLIAQLFLAK